MSRKTVKCVRCGDPAETRTFEPDRTFWGKLTGKETMVTRVRHIRIQGAWVERDEGGISVKQADEEQPVCDPCWGLFVGRFLQGRSVAPLDHEHVWKRGKHDAMCELCYKTTPFYE